MRDHHFYAVIIGSEILDKRREDKHFRFLQDALLRRSHTLYAAFFIKDDYNLIKNTFTGIHNDPKSVLFSFGGIGTTPDDLTREVAAEVFTCKQLVRNKRFEKDIIERFGDDAYPHRIKMADIPEGAKLLKNPVNNMSGFSLEDRFFFMPGFPEMAHPMVEDILEHRFVHAPNTLFRKTLIAKTSENTLIDLMKTLDNEIELSSLPILSHGRPEVELSLASYDKAKLDAAFATFIKRLDSLKTPYEVLENE